jgi:hypothetical protein
MKFLIGAIIALAFTFSSAAQDFRRMTGDELKKAVPAKAPVIKENIETELRTASGITDGKKNLFGVVIITAGYEAEGKYTHFLRLQRGIVVGDLALKADDYVFGYQRIDNESLRVMFYVASSGSLVGAALAKVEKKPGAIYSFLIAPPENGTGRIYIGRFRLDYTME